MVFRCCVPCCTHSNNEMKMHRFPYHDIPVYNIWIQRIGNKKLKDLNPADVNKNYRVCHKHFSTYSINIFGRQHSCLKERSLPTIFLPDFQEPATAKNSVFDNSVTSTNFTCDQYVDEEDLRTDTFTQSEDCTWKATLPTNDENFRLNEQASDNTEDPLRYQRGFSQQKQADNNKIDKLKNKGFWKWLNILKKVSVTKASDLPPKAKKLYRICQNLRKVNLQMQKEKNNKKRLTKAAKFLETQDFMRCTVNVPTFNFIMSQMRQQKKKSKGRRFSIDDKIFALSIYKQSAKAYRLLQKVFVLPSKFTLKKLLNAIPLDSGLNTSVLQSIKKVVMKLQAEDRICTLLFDEIALTSSLQYNRKSGFIEGFVDLGEGVRYPRFADHALVLMACGLRKKWKQAISFYFVEGSIKTPDLVKNIKTVIRSLREIGLNIVTTVCDQHTTNTAAITQLKKETNEYCLKNNIENRYFGFTIDGIEVVPFYDAPHLLKGIRNNMLEADVSFKWKSGKQVASWKDIVASYEIDDDDPEYKMLHKLTDSHIYKDKIKKMKVSLAAQVLSQRVSNIMRNLARLGVNGIPESTKDTADFLLFIDKLFDSMNGSTIEPEHGKLLRCAITKKSPHSQFWMKALKVLDTIKFIKHDGKEFVPPTVINWKHTIRAAKYLWEILQKKYSFSFLLLRNLNQDPLENFFGQIRSHGTRNVNPNCSSFRQSFTILLINNFMSSHSSGANCEKDETEGALDSLRDFILNQSFVSNPSDIILPHCSTIDQTRTDNMGVAAYVAGFMARRILFEIKYCKHCKSQLTSTDISNNAYHLITARSYHKNALLYPSSTFMFLFKKYSFNLNYCINKFCSHLHLKLLLHHVFQEEDFLEFTCAEHNIFNLFKTYFSTFFIHVFVKNINSSLKGSDEHKPKDCYGMVRIAACQRYQKFKQKK